MTKKIIIGLVLSLMLLVTSEYLFLHEVFDVRRLPLIVVGLLGTVLGSFLFAFFFIQYRKATDEHTQ